jgi:hypothetical protein
MGYTLKYADEALKRDREIVLAAVRNRSFAYRDAQISMKKDKTIVLAALEDKGFPLGDVVDVLRLVGKNHKHCDTALIFVSFFTLHLCSRLVKTRTNE